MIQINFFMKDLNFEIPVFTAALLKYQKILRNNSCFFKFNWVDSKEKMP